MLAPQIEVILTHAGAELARVALPPGDYVIGRDVSAHIHADTPLISRQHARLTIGPDLLLLEDLGSSNGTFIGEQSVSSATPISAGQLMRLGDVQLQIKHLAVPPAVPAAERYVIGEQVACGGMGAILDVRDAAIARSVAMKVMLEGSTPEDAARFVQEAKITGQLEHPNIVPVHELATDERGQPYYTMKFVRGITLKKVLELMAAGTAATLAKHPLGTLLTIFQKVCDAVAFAHNKGVIHRDLKPENIMLGDFGEVLVMDWGLAKVIGSAENISAAERVEATTGSTLAGAIMGTPQYMAPEQARGEIDVLDARTDIYALGAILYHVLALRPSVSGDDAWAIVDKVARGDVDALVGPPRRGGRGERSEAATSHGGRRGAPSLPSIPDSLAAVVRKAMAFDPTQRYATVADLQRDIEAFQSGFATSAEKAGAWKQFTLFVRRHKAASIGAAAVLLIGGTLGTKAVVEGRRAERALINLQKTAPTFATEADSLMLKGDVDGALSRLETATELDPQNPRWHGRKGQVLDASLRFPEAAAAYARAAALDPAGPWSAARQASEKLAAALQPDGHYPMPMLQDLYALAIREGRSGDALHLSAPLQKAAKEILPPLQARIDAWLGKDAPKLWIQADGSLSLDLVKRGLTDLSPLKGMPLGSLSMESNKISDLSPLAGMPLRSFWALGNPISDLSPLAGMRLTWISLAHTQVSDLSPLKGMPLERFFGQTHTITDISALREAPLKWARLEGARVSDISPLAGKQITELWLSGNPVKDFAALRGMPLKILHVGYCGSHPGLVEILMSLTQLEVLSADTTLPGFERLRTHPSLKYLGHVDNQHLLYPPVAEYWAAWDAKKAATKK